MLQDNKFVHHDNTISRCSAGRCQSPDICRLRAGNDVCLMYDVNIDIRLEFFKPRKTQYFQTREGSCQMSAFTVCSLETTRSTTQLDIAPHQCFMSGWHFLLQYSCGLWIGNLSFLCLSEVWIMSY